MSPFQPGLSFCNAHEQGYLNLAIGETQYGMSPLSQKALLESATTAFRYPDSSAKRLVDALAKHHQVDPEMIFIGNGTDEVIFSAALVFLNPGAECLMSRPTFSGFETSTQFVRATPLYSPLKNMKVDIEDIAKLLLRKPKLWLLCNPHNPTGTILSHSEEESLLDLAYQQGVITLVDEAYAEYADPTQFQSALSLIHEYPNILVTRTFSKAYGLGGLRCGYAIGSKALIRELQKTRDAIPFNVNRLAIETAAVALTDQAFVRSCYEKTERAKKLFCTRLKNMGLKSYPSFTNFVLVEFDCETDWICEEMKEKYRILVRSGHPFGIPQCIRITLGTEEQMEYVANCLEEIYAKQPR